LQFFKLLLRKTHCVLQSRHDNIWLTVLRSGLTKVGMTLFTYLNDKCFF